MSRSEGIVFYLRGDSYNWLAPVTLRSLRRNWEGNIHFVFSRNSCSLLKDKLKDIGIGWSEDNSEHGITGGGKRDAWCAKGLAHIQAYPFDINAYYDLDHIFLKPVEQEIFDRASAEGLFCEKNPAPSGRSVLKSLLNSALNLSIGAFHGVNGGFVVSKKGSPLLLEWRDMMLKFRGMAGLRHNPEENALAAMACLGKISPAPYHHSWVEGPGNNKKGADPVFPEHVRALHCSRGTYTLFPMWHKELKTACQEDFMGLGTFKKEYGLGNVGMPRDVLGENKDE